MKLEFDNNKVVISFYQIAQRNTCYENVDRKSNSLIFSVDKDLKKLNSPECPNGSFFDICEVGGSDAKFLGEKRLICSNKNNQKQTVLYSLDHRDRIGKRVVIEHVDGIMMGGRKAVTTDAVRFRDEPSINSKIINVNLTTESCCSDSVEKKYTSLQKDWNVVVIARTKEKEKIEKWENYWYYIAVYQSEFSQVYGWVFGQFIKIE
ncbi:hypothetical protein [Leptospira neocaledonica]|uniref:Uncharacterized protein n=1 Tax=Leptospira neocaledonica TaxID=2023192 RepID=A0A2M9ZTD8_9LEPT|nr:hypothetical protein [Leptospira neocaledonica]PJZ75285.1 hypothetical protein CH365_19730 [Leptospira neocaledonica]